MKRLKRFIKFLGFRAGFWLYLRKKLGTEVVDIRVPEIKTPLRLRLQTSDLPMFEDVLFYKQYDSPPPYPSIRFIIDAGANVGYTSVFYANKYPEARIIALEPDDSNFELLCQNARHYPQITPVKAALWFRSTQLRVSNPEAPKSAFRVEEAGGEQGIHALTIDEILQRYSSSGVCILKIDIEGAEKELFEHPGCQSWLPRVSQLVIELHDRFKPGCQAAVTGAISALPHQHSQNGENDIFTFSHRPA